MNNNFVCMTDGVNCNKQLAEVTFLLSTFLSLLESDLEESLS